MDERKANDGSPRPPTMHQLHQLCCVLLYSDHRFIQAASFSYIRGCARSVDVCAVWKNEFLYLFLVIKCRFNWLDHSGSVNQHYLHVD